MFFMKHTHFDKQTSWAVLMMKGLTGIVCNNPEQSPFTITRLTKLTVHFGQVFQPCFRASHFPLLESIGMSKAMNVQAIVPFAFCPLTLVRCHKTFSQAAPGKK